MKTADEQQAKMNKKESERGSALVMVLLISFLLLVVAGGLIFAASMHTANVTDAVAEEQAYSAAESGLQSAINILRGNVVPNPLLDSSKPASDSANKITYRRAVQTTTSNIPNDSSASRLSRWMSYHSTFSDRVTLTDANTYTAFNGLAYNVTVTEADNSNAITFYTTGKIGGSNTYPILGSSAGDGVLIQYVSVPQTSPTTVNVSSGSNDTSLGSFSVRVCGSGATLSTDVRFSIVFKMTAPYKGNREIRGSIKAGKISTIAGNELKIDFDSASGQAPVSELLGSKITITNDDPLVITPSSTSCTGAATTAQVNANVTQGEPRRLLLRSTGFGPRGAEKQLEAIILKDPFNGLSAPATITLVGDNTNGDALFEPFSSAATNYSGDDLSSNMMIPPVGVSATNLTAAQIEQILNDAIKKPEQLIGKPADVTDELPDWLSSPIDVHNTLYGPNGLKEIAQASGGYWAAGQTPTSLGNNGTGQGITFIEGDIELKGNGGGILVCTGKLTLNGAFDFKGLIIVTGADGIRRNGSGQGQVHGNVVVAPYKITTQTINGTVTTTYSWLAPKYDMRGGGTSETRFDSNSVSNGLLAIDNIVIGVAEK